jgi:hypothetical protein
MHRSKKASACSISSFTASIYQVRTGERIVGKSGNEILGDAQDFLKLTDAIREAMYE